MNSKHRRIHGLMVRIFSIAAFVLVPLVAAVAVFLVYLVSVAKEEVAVNAEREARIIAVQESRVFIGIRNILFGVSQFSEVKSGNRRDCDKTLALLLDHINKPEKQFLNLAIAEASGDVVCSALPFAGSVNISDRDYFQRAVSMRDFSFGNYQIGRVTGQETVNFGYPVMDETGGVRYVITIALELNALHEIFDRIGLPAGTSLTLTDEDYNILVRHPSAFYLIGRAYDKREVVESSGGDGSAEAVDIDGVPRILGFSTIRSPNNLSYFHVVIGLPAYDLFDHFLPSLSDWISGLALIIVLAAAAGWYVSGRIIVHLKTEDQIG